MFSKCVFKFLLAVTGLTQILTQITVSLWLDAPLRCCPCLQWASTLLCVHMWLNSMTWKWNWCMYKPTKGQEHCVYVCVCWNVWLCWGLSAMLLISNTDFVMWTLQTLFHILTLRTELVFSHWKYIIINLMRWISFLQQMANSSIISRYNTNAIFYIAILKTDNTQDLQIILVISMM